MKRNKLPAIVISLAFFAMCLFPNKTYAESITTGKVTAEANLRVRNAPNTDAEQIGSAQYQSRVTILETLSAGNGCDDPWVKIRTYTGLEGYSCSTWIKDIKTTDLAAEIANSDMSTEGKEMASMTSEQFNKYLDDQGFPESYKVKLRALHDLHPAWIFKAVPARDSWQNILNYENGNGRSLLSVGTSRKAAGWESYLSTEEADYDIIADRFIPHDGQTWFQADRRAIAYYLDPRNFLDERNIFAFEELHYHPSYQTLEVVQNTLNSSFLNQFDTYYLDAAQATNVSAVYLAALSRNEVGTSWDNIVTNGNAGVLNDFNGNPVNLSGYYNFFNIGASSSSNPKLKSLLAAKSYGWTDQRTSIVEGSKFVADRYVNQGQDTSYFQHRNVANYAALGMWHQYSTGIEAPYAPASTTYNSYNKYGLIEKDFVFLIPVFDGMPESTTLPPLGNPNNWLYAIEVNGSVVSNFNTRVQDYTVYVPYAETVHIFADQAVTNSTVTGDIGDVKLTGKTTVARITVTAENKDVRVYTVTIVRGDAPVTPTPTPTPAPTQTPTPASTPSPTPTPTPSATPKPNGNTTSTVDLNTVLANVGYKPQSDYFSGITFGTTIESIIKNINTKYPEVTVNVTDVNGVVQNQGMIGTGDKITLSINGTKKTFSALIYGDLSGDGIVNTLDLLTIKKAILGDTNLSGVFVKAADIDGNGTINTLDLLHIKKAVIDGTNISQNR